MVINLPHLTKCLPEHFSYFLAHDLPLMDVGRCSLRNDFVHLLLSSVHRVGHWESGCTVATSTCFPGGILVIYLFLTAVSLHCCMGSPLVAESRGSSLVAERELRMMASRCRAQALERVGLSGCGAQVWSPSGMCSLPRPRIEPTLPAWVRGL